MTRLPTVRDLAEEFQKQYLAIGGTVTSFDGIDRGEKDFKALLTRVKAERTAAGLFRWTVCRRPV